MQELPPPPPVPTTQFCYRHPGTPTGVHCTRCGRPICTECMIQAPVGFQCPECVARARQEFRQGPGRRVAMGRFSVTNVLLVAIGVMYLVEVVVGGANSLLSGPSVRSLYDLGGMFPPAIAIDGQYWRLFSSMFLHAGLLHIAFNAYALWAFGTVVEQDFGHVKFVLIYFVSGFVASAASYAFGPVNVVAVGASGAIFGIFGAFMAYSYRRRHLALHAARLRAAMTIIVLNALLTIGFQAIDWRAHVGGAIAGFVAGLAAEGVGPPAQRKAILVSGFAALIAVGIGLIVWRTPQVTAEFQHLIHGG